MFQSIGGDVTFVTTNAKMKIAIALTDWLGCANWHVYEMRSDSPVTASPFLARSSGFSLTSLQQAGAGPKEVLAVTFQFDE
jgi:hypothetical protein